MDPSTLVTLVTSSIGLAVFLMFSFFFSGTETAFFSLNSLEKEAFKSRATGKRRAYVSQVMAHPDNVLVTILTGNMIVNIFATDIFASSLSTSISKQLGFIAPNVVSIVLMTVLLFIFGEMTPKNIAVRHPLAFSRFAVAPFHFLSLCLAPITGPLNSLRMKIMTIFPENMVQPEEKKESLVSFAAQIGVNKGILNKYEARLFDSYFDFRKKRVSDIMIPRTEIRGVEISTGIDTLLALIEKNELGVTDSYLFAYKKDVDHLRGYIDLKHLIPYKYGKKKDGSLSALVISFHTVPETKKVNDLIRKLEETGKEVALIIDEYGGTAGFVTFKAIIREILEYFYSKDSDSIVEISQNLYSIPGSTKTDQIEEFFGVTFGFESRTISGMIIEQFGEIPEEGTSVVLSGIEFTVKKTGDTKISILEARRTHSS